jgi:ribosomal protein S18 acetylase RimI-like enzyme
MSRNREIRHFQPGDEQVIVEIYNSAFSENPPFFPRTKESWIWRYVNRPGFDTKSILIADECGKAVSSLVITFAKVMISGTPRKVALIDDVGTIPEHQGKGHANALVELAIKIADEKECYAVHLTANPKGSAIRIYEKHGFSVIANLEIMGSILNTYGLSKAVGYRYFIPMLFLKSFVRLKEKHQSNLEIKIICGSELKEIFLKIQDNYPSQNGFILMNNEYINWLIDSRPIGRIIGLTAYIQNEIVGMLSVSVHTMQTNNRVFRIADIGNIIIPDKFWTQEILSEFLQTARLVAQKDLGCVLASVAVDARDISLCDACKHSKFYPLEHGAAMIHPLSNHDKLREIKSVLWAQPLETVVADP